MATSRTAAERPERVRVRVPMAERFGSRVNAMAAWLQQLEAQLIREEAERRSGDATISAWIERWIRNRAVTSSPNMGVNIGGHPGEGWPKRF